MLQQCNFYFVLFLLTKKKNQHSNVCSSFSVQYVWMCVKCKYLRNITDFMFGYTSLLFYMVYGTQNGKCLFWLWSVNKSKHSPIRNTIVWTDYFHLEIHFNNIRHRHFRYNIHPYSCHMNLENLIHSEHSVPVPHILDIWHVYDVMDRNFGMKVLTVY